MIVSRLRIGLVQHFKLGFKFRHLLGLRLYYALGFRLLFCLRLGLRFRFLCFRFMIVSRLRVGLVQQFKLGFKFGHLLGLRLYYALGFRYRFYIKFRLQFGLRFLFDFRFGLRLWFRLAFTYDSLQVDREDITEFILLLLSLITQHFHNVHCLTNSIVSCKRSKLFKIYKRLYTYYRYIIRTAVEYSQFCQRHQFLGYGQIHRQPHLELALTYEIGYTVGGDYYHIIRLRSEFVHQRCLIYLRVDLGASHSGYYRAPVLRFKLFDIIDLPPIVHILSEALIRSKLPYGTVDISVQSAVTHIYTKALAFFIDSKSAQSRLHIGRRSVKCTALFDLTVDSHERLFNVCF